MAILGVIAVLAVPEFNRAQVRSKATSESENLRIIESAKSQFSRANPGKQISASFAADGRTPQDLVSFLPNGKLPVSPWGATYSYVSDLRSTVKSGANGDASKEPSILPLDANGFNDILQADRVYYKRPGVDAWVSPSTVVVTAGTTGTTTGTIPTSGVGTGVGNGSGIGTAGVGSGVGNGTIDTFGIGTAGVGSGVGNGSGIGTAGVGIGVGNGSGIGTVGTGTGCTGTQTDNCPQDSESERDGAASNEEPECDPPQDDYHLGTLRKKKTPPATGWEVVAERVENPNDEDPCTDWTGVGHYEYVSKLERTGAPPTDTVTTTPATGCCPAYTVTEHVFPTQWSACKDEWHVSPVIVDLFGTGDINLLAPHGWQKGRKGKVSIFNTKLFEMTPNTPLRYWEWVTPKAGILVYSADGPPTYASGANLFGNRTWGKVWKHGYEPMATLDVDGNGSLQGKELAAIWVWVDANSDAVLSPEEVVPAKSVFSVLSVRPLGGEDYYIPLGAKLVDRDGVNGVWVGSWDWWSTTPSQPKESLYLPQVTPQGPVCMYRWKQTSLMEGQDEANRYEGYFLFGMLEGKLIVGSTSSLTPSNLNGKVR